MENWFIQYVDPCLDGLRLPVTGMGQLAPVSHGAKGALAFSQCLVLKDGTVTNKKMIDLWACLENSTWFPQCQTNSGRVFLLAVQGAEHEQANHSSRFRHR